MDDDCFRAAGRKYEQEEPVAFAEVEVTAHVTWKDAAHSPEDTLWVSESLFAALARQTSLSRINIFRRTQLNASECTVLEQELEMLAASASDQDVRLAARLVREKARAVSENRGQTVLLVEGP